MNDDELIQIYQVVKQSAHPDPVGYMVRAMKYSDADPDYTSVDGTVGFMPADPVRARSMVGAQAVNGLEENITATMAMDVSLYDSLFEDDSSYGLIERMIIAFHEGEDAINNPSADMKEFLKDLPDLREEMNELLNPRLATIDDVIKILTGSDKPPKKHLEAFKEIVNGS